MAQLGMHTVRRNVFRSGIAQDVSVPAKSLDRNRLQSIGRERGTMNETGVVFFPVTFMWRTFLPVKGEILHGVIHIAVWSCEFLVTAVQWIDEGRNLKKKYLVFGRVEGESLGPVSLSGRAGTDDINL
ncbi:hypothetical protein WN943_028951 [Citrus x changshan-huyou]